jgi:hypothetical protein
MQTSQRSNADVIKLTPAGGQAWLSTAGFDMAWILSPAFISVACVLLFRQQMEATENVPLWVWVCFILLIDVAHVYASLFRTYLDPQAFQKNRTVLLAMPVIAWIGGSLLYSVSDLYFWRCLAYLAVFHFIRQQFGFMVLYSRKEPEACKKFRWLDCAAIYMATIYPMLFWHTHLRNFNWFVAGDFFEGLPAVVSHLGLAVYALVAAGYLVKEIAMARQGFINVPKNLLLIGTALSWWVCIVTVNSDMAFTITNVVCHGIPYMALIWIYHGPTALAKTSTGQSAIDSATKMIDDTAIENATSEKTTTGKMANEKIAIEMTAGGRTMSRKSFSQMATTSSFWSQGWKKFLISNAFIFIAFLGLLAYLEEGFWDGLVWREHLGLFAPFWHLPHVGDGALLALIVPFLALPQSTHYLLDGFIWRVRQRNNIWSA